MINYTFLKKTLNHFSVITGCIILLGCQTVNKFDVLISKDTIHFRSNDIKKGLAQGDLFLLIDITVLRKDCENNCIKWHAIRKDTKKDLMLTKSNTIQDDIIYGVILKGMDQRVEPEKLTSGEYSVSATIEKFDSQKKPLKSILVYRKFLINEGKSGSIKVQHLD